MCCYVRLMTARRPLPLSPAAAPSVVLADPLAELSAELAALRREVTRLQKDKRKLESQLSAVAQAADTDTLTGLSNRRYFMHALQRRIARVARYKERDAIIYVDVDGLKAINDRHGHGAGDHVLRAIASCLRSETRKSDVVARIGGDEFAMLIDHVDAASARTKVQALRRALKDYPCEWQSQDVPLSAAFGMAMIDGEDDVEALLGRADSAMYAAKRADDELQGLPPGA